MLPNLNEDNDKAIWDWMVTSLLHQLHLYVGNDTINFFSFKFLWHSGIPLMWSTLSWKALHGKLPFDVNLQPKGIQVVSRCTCCSKPSVESLNHVCVGSELAQRIWNYFECKMGISSRAGLLCQKINEWWAC